MNCNSKQRFKVKIQLWIVTLNLCFWIFSLNLYFESWLWMFTMNICFESLICIFTLNFYLSLYFQFLFWIFTFNFCVVSLFWICTFNSYFEFFLWFFTLTLFLKSLLWIFTLNRYLTEIYRLQLREWNSPILKLRRPVLMELSSVHACRSPGLSKNRSIVWFMWPSRMVSSHHTKFHIGLHFNGTCIYLS